MTLFPTRTISVLEKIFPITSMIEVLKQNRIELTELLHKILKWLNFPFFLQINLKFKLLNYNLFLYNLNNLTNSLFPIFHVFFSQVKQNQKLFLIKALIK